VNPSTPFANLIALAGAALAPTALAGDNLLGAYLWNVTTQNGDAIVEPGETASVSLWLDMTPSVVDSNTDGNQGLSAMIFDSLGSPSAANGRILGWQINEDLGFLTGDLTTTDGVSLFDTNLGQLPLFGPFSKNDPIHLIDFEWAPTVAGDYVVEYTTSTHALEFWTGFFSNAQSTPAIPIEAQISFQVVPAPASLLTVAPIALGFLRRRRSS